MFNKLLIFFFVLFFSFGVNAIEVENKILSVEGSQYHISTTIICKNDAGILRLSITIPEEYTFKLYNDPNLLIDSRNNVIKFYTNIDTDSKIEIHFQLSKKSEEGTEASIPTHVEYTVDGVMKVVDKEIVLSEREIVSTQEMDSISSYHEKKSTEAIKKDALAENRMKNLPSSSAGSNEKPKDEESLSMPAGYNSSTNSGLNSNKLYAVQILSLQFFNEKRFLEFLKSYKIKPVEVFKKELNGATKIYIGKFQTYDEAKQYKEKLIKENNLTDSFVVSY